MAQGRRWKRAAFFTAVALATIAAGKLDAGESEASRNAVVAVVGGEKITEGDLDDMLALMSPLERRSYEGEEGRKLLLDVLIKNNLLVSEAEKAKLNKDPAIKRDIEDARIRILASAYFQRYIATPLGVTDEDVNRYYEEHKDEFLEPARVTLRHILVATPEEGEKVLARLANGEDFAAVAKEVSQDEYTANQGGLIGDVTDEYTPFQVGKCEDYREVVFNLAPKTPSAVTASDRGYHIFYVDKKEDARYAPLADVSGRIRQRILVPDADVRAYFDAHRDEYVIEKGILSRRLEVATVAQARELLRRARAGEDFESLVKLYSSDTATKDSGGLIGWVRPDGYIQGVGTNAEIEKALFAAAEGDVVGPFEVESGFQIYHIERRRDFRQMDFEEVRDRIFSTLADERRRAYYDQAFQDLERKSTVERFGWARTYDDMAPDELMAKAEGAATPLVAIQAYEKFVQRFPDNADADKALFMAGFLYSEEVRDYSTAKDKFRALLAAYPDSDYAPSASWMNEHMGEEGLTLPPELPGPSGGGEETTEPNAPAESE